jgi:hypothetical protein
VVHTAQRRVPLPQPKRLPGTLPLRYVQPFHVPDARTARERPRPERSRGGAMTSGLGPPQTMAARPQGAAPTRHRSLEISRFSRFCLEGMSGFSTIWQVDRHSLSLALLVRRASAAEAEMIDEELEARVAAAERQIAVITALVKDIPCQARLALREILAEFEAPAG